ncbi:hypothetical protein K402DRAFT_394726 [Aulographum hederae CBS 113979]|uniref:PXA domain-containing protein n=1 Tax=Aulographum hederae CBS 113979 TaxID=1176131 RepID=A0A6G1GWQ0_9PEZI|nr:hypothetical protein K402DRAFT_394726 [Aulographum hederae CBS 113979]
MDLEDATRPDAMPQKNHEMAEETPREETQEQPQEKDTVGIISALPTENGASPQATENGFQNIAQALTNHTLQFLSTASNESLGACLVGLGATTYFVLGRVGLVIIGVVGGVALHANWSWDGSERADKRAEEKRQKEAGVDIVQRVLKWRTQAQEGKQEEDDEEPGNFAALLSSEDRADFVGFQPETTSALHELTDAVIRDYVKWWYSPILPKELAFPGACRQTLVKFLLSVSNQISRKRPSDALVDFVTNSTSIVIVFFNELSTAINASPMSAPADAVETYLELKPESSLADVLNVQHQEKKLDMIAEDILKSFLDPKVYSCDPARIFLREVLAKLILDKTVETCSRPEWINDWIVYLLEEGEPELLSAIDAGVEGPSGKALDVVKQRASESTPESRNADHAAVEESNANHRRVVSRAQDAMDEAMREAQRLTQLMIEEDERRRKEQETSPATAQSETKLPHEPVPAQEGMATSSMHSFAPSISGSTLNDDASESTTQGAATPSSSQSDSVGDTDLSASKALSMESTRDEPKTVAQAPLPQFTSFSQLPPELLDGRQEPAILTLHKANINIFDDAMPGEKSNIKAKPTADYLIQIEPASAQFPGWMIARKFADFETLHEVIRRISIISGVLEFNQVHPALPGWKGRTKAALRQELEHYLIDAIKHQPLAESEGMKRFLEKDQGLNKSPGASKGFGWPTPSAFENMGKGMMDVLTTAPKGVAGGGKAIIGGVTGVFGGITPKKMPAASHPNRSSTSIVPSQTTPVPSSHTRAESAIAALPKARQSTDSLKRFSMVDSQPSPVAQMEKQPMWNSSIEEELKPRPSFSSRTSTRGLSSPGSSRPPSDRQSMEFSLAGDQVVQLPPPPSEIDDYEEEMKWQTAKRNLVVEHTNPMTRVSTSGSRMSLDIKPTADTQPAEETSLPVRLPKRDSKVKSPLTEPETQVIIELIFATINELYTLSSAWTIRKTLLTAAKNFLLRSGNPQLESIRQLLQSTVIDANTDDAGIAAHLRKVRENSLPTEEELKLWPAPLSPEEKEKLRVKARKLLVERGMPVQLVSVMGAQASGEALGRVFDCLQMEKVARGFIFGLVLQGIRGVVT